MSLTRAPSPIWYFPNNVGIQLDDTYFLFVLNNVFPFLPLPVFQDNQGVNPWTEPVQFLANGTLPNNLYWVEGTYRVQVRQGNTMDALLIYDILNFVVGPGGITPGNTTVAYDNQITNPQFAFINFVSPLTITVAGTYSVAPGWDLVLTGTGTTTVTQNIFSGVDVSGLPIPGAPPTALQIANTLWTTATLQQTFIKNGALWADEAVSISITVEAVTLDQLISVLYTPSMGTSVPIISNQLATTSGYQVIADAASLIPSTSATPSNLASVAIQIILPVNGAISITNVQVFGQALPLPAPYIEETVNRAIDHSFNVYANELIIKPKSSIITGWNFALNPWQFGSRAVIPITPQCQYITDQTILYQEAAGNLSVGQASLAQGGGLIVQPSANASATRFALIQYIDPSTVLPYWNFFLSSLARARIVTTSGTSIPLKMRLIYSGALAAPISPTEPIASWTLGSDPVFSSAWATLIPQNDPAYILQNPSVATHESGIVAPPMSYNQFPMPPATTGAMTLGIVLYTMTRMIPNVGDAIVFDKVSLVPNRFAVDTNPITWDESLRQCQFYYEGFNSAAQFLQAEQLGEGQVSTTSTVFLISREFSFQFLAVKRAVPTVTLFAVDGSQSIVTGSLYNGGALVASGDILINNWKQNIINQFGVGYLPVNISQFLTTVAAPMFPEGFLNFNYTADARMGR